MIGTLCDFVKLYSIMIVNNYLQLIIANNHFRPNYIRSYSC